MAFQVGMSDVVLLARTIRDVAKACASAPDKFKEATELCLRLEVVVGLAEDQLRAIASVPVGVTAEPVKVFESDPRYTDELRIILDNCRATVRRLGLLQFKYSSLQTSKRNILENLMYSYESVTKDLDRIQQQLLLDTMTLNLFISHMIPCRPDFGPSSTSTGSSTSTWRHELVEDVDLGRKTSETPDLSRCSRTQEAIHEALKSREQQLRSIIPPELFESIELLKYRDQMALQVPERSCRYSATEEWLSRLPEGWQRVEDGSCGYRYNDLFMGYSGASSRSYACENPFPARLEVKSDPLPPIWEVCETAIHRPFYRNKVSGYTTSERPLYVIEDNLDDLFVGFRSQDWLPWDLSDDTSLRLVRQINVAGEGPSDSDITQALPTGWTWRRDACNRPLYFFIEAGGSGQPWTSTVHPAMFPERKHRQSPRLPEGWERRLDTWGSVFYIHHRSASWQREAPEDSA